MRFLTLAKEQLTKASERLDVAERAVEVCHDGGEETSDVGLGLAKDIVDKGGGTGGGDDALDRVHDSVEGGLDVDVDLCVDTGEGINTDGRVVELASESGHVGDEALDEADELADLALLLGDGWGGESTGDESWDGEDGELHFECFVVVFCGGGLKNE